MLLIVVDAIPSTARGVALSVCVLARLGARWFDPHYDVSTSSVIILAGVITAAVLLAA